MRSDTTTLVRLPRQPFGDTTLTRLNSFAIALTALTIAAPTYARAGTETFSATISLQVDIASLDYTAVYELPSFDTSLGTLTGVTVGYTSNITAEVDIFNINDTEQAYTAANAWVSVNLSGPDGTVVYTTAQAGPFIGSVAAADPSTGYTQVALTGNTATDTSSTAVTGDLSAYETPGGADVAFIATNTDGGSYTGVTTGDPTVSLFFSGDATAGGTATVTYTFSTAIAAVPEPATMSIFCLGLLGLRAARRRV